MVPQMRRAGLTPRALVPRVRRARGRRSRRACPLRRRYQCANGRDLAQAPPPYASPGVAAGLCALEARETIASTLTARVEELLAERNANLAR